MSKKKSKHLYLALRCLMLKKQVTSAHRILSFPCLPPVLS
ncbi:hypothetical protein B4166_2156 [Caldibacillus thermoamylovorans]|uniref:Uncharacterized protein n=1 Tax=Caldibacillus thermoamylovorans TaxID=35841 RepID=A0ABD4A8S4_9BACI|nr:hypothetical protein B4166_2156 [Caldibacillus thermoamylovorans]KIO73433.1 hypothetical protein B4167_2156 [Caldibacillus thermoamylovorans]